jgi:hypothetical protein
VLACCMELTSRSAFFSYLKDAYVGEVEGVCGVDATCLSPFGLVSDDSCNTYSVDIGTKSRLELMKIDAKIRTRLWGASGSSFSVCC